MRNKEFPEDRLEREELPDVCVPDHHVCSDCPGHVLEASLFWQLPEEAGVGELKGCCQEAWPMGQAGRAFQQHSDLMVSHLVQAVNKRGKQVGPTAKACQHADKIWSPASSRQPTLLCGRRLICIQRLALSCCLPQNLFQDSPSLQAVLLFTANMPEGGIDWQRETAQMHKGQAGNHSLTTPHQQQLHTVAMRFLGRPALCDMNYNR